MPFPSRLGRVRRVPQTLPHATPYKNLLLKRIVIALAGLSVATNAHQLPAKATCKQQAHFPPPAVSQHQLPLNRVMRKNMLSVSYLPKYTPLRGRGSGSGGAGPHHKPKPLHREFLGEKKREIKTSQESSGDLQPVVHTKPLEPPRPLPLQHHIRRSLLQFHTRCTNHGAR